ncbi:MAG: (2Fe-2S)-binding protein, partial [Rhodoferax sp.]
CGLLFRAASYEAAPDEVMATIERLLGLGGTDVLRYADKKRGQRRTARLTRVGDHAELTAFVLAGDISAETWIKPLLQDELPAQAYGRLLLVPGAKAPIALHARGKQVCTCLNVTDTAINAYLAGSRGIDEVRLASLQAELKCGTQCGSCVPELRKMLKATLPLAQAA